MSHRTYLFVINPIAGGLNKTQYISSIENMFARHDAVFDVYETTGNSDQEKIVEHIEKTKPEVVVAVGGDGTCTMVAEAIRDKNVTLGIVPLGSANGLATELTIPANTLQATELLLTGKSLKIDGVLVNDKLCLHLSDLGLNARVIKRFEREKRRGMFGYFKQYLSEISHLEPRRYQFVVNGHSFRRRAHMVVIANAAKYGTGAIVNPIGVINDGKFEICIIKPFPVWSIFPLIIALFRGTLKRFRYVKILSCTKIKVYNKHGETLQIDGEVIGEPPVVDASIIPGAISVIVPNDFTPG